MSDLNIILPSKPIAVSENETEGIYEIEGLYPGYGHTLGNSLRRIILSSLPGFAITAVKISGVNHEFSTIPGIKEDVIAIILNLKRVRFKVVGDEPLTVNLKIKGSKTVTAGDIETPGQAEVVNKDYVIATITDKNASLEMEITLEKGLGYVAKESLQKDKVEIGTIALDAIFTPIRRVSYEVEPMRVGNRTNFNKLRVTIETDGVVSPREALTRSIEIMISQLHAIVGFKELDLASGADSESGTESESAGDSDMAKVRIEDLDLSVRTMKALTGASIRTVGGLMRKKEDDLLELDGLGSKGLEEIKEALALRGIVLKK